MQLMLIFRYRFVIVEKPFLMPVEDVFSITGVVQLEQAKLKQELSIQGSC